MSDDTGTHRTLRIGKESRVSVTWAVLASVVVGVTSAAVTWGQFSERITTLSQDNTEQTQELRAQATELRSQDRKITVIETRFAEIIDRLARIDRKLDRERQ
jgi:hypothetical protein